jgi:hypothetical protein
MHYGDDVFCYSNCAIAQSECPTYQANGTCHWELQRESIPPQIFRAVDRDSYKDFPWWLLTFYYSCPRVDVYGAPCRRHYYVVKAPDKEFAKSMAYWHRQLLEVPSELPRGMDATKLMGQPTNLDDLRKDPHYTVIEEQNCLVCGVLSTTFNGGCAHHHRLGGWIHDPQELTEVSFGSFEEERKQRWRRIRVECESCRV